MALRSREIRMTQTADIKPFWLEDGATLYNDLCIHGWQLWTSCTIHLSTDPTAQINQAPHQKYSTKNILILHFFQCLEHCDSEINGQCFGIVHDVQSCHPALLSLNAEVVIQCGTIFEPKGFDISRLCHSNLSRSEGHSFCGRKKRVHLRSISDPHLSST